MFDGCPEDAERAALDIFALMTSNLGTRVNASVMDGPSLNAIPSSASLCVLANLGQVETTSALADSGARRCFIAHEIALWAEANVPGARRSLSEFPAAVVANSARVPILGKLSLPVTLGTQSYLADFYVLPTCPYDLILGLDFFEKYDLSISDYARKICIGRDNCLQRCDCKSSRSSNGAASLAALNTSTFGSTVQVIEPLSNSNRFFEVYMYESVAQERQLYFARHRVIRI